MREAPDIPISRLSAHLHSAYGLSAAAIEFLPLGADPGSAVYRVTTEYGAQYLLKLRLGTFSAAAVAIPNLLARTDMRQIIAPIAAPGGNALWTHLGSLAVTLYPFISGRSGWETTLSQQQWTDLGYALRTLHTSALPPAQRHLLQHEAYAPSWRNKVASLLDNIGDYATGEPAAATLIGLLREKRALIRHLIERAERLAVALTRNSPPHCLCHGDIHAGNILIDAQGRLYLVDWDTLILAPKERDLMFIGGGVGGIWNEPRQTEWFYRGYGPADIDLRALAYYRHERIIQDIGEICELLLQTDCGDADRHMLIEQFTEQFAPGNVVDMARST